jgi:hypothetical protein
LATLRCTNTSPGSKAHNFIGGHSAVRAANPQVFGGLLLVPSCSKKPGRSWDHARGPRLGLLVKQIKASDIGGENNQSV